MVAKTQSGTNQVRNLSNYTKCLNKENWQSPFEVYFGRKNNELNCCGLPENRSSPEIRKVSKPTKDDFNKFKKLRSKIIKRVLFSDERLAKRTVENSIVNEVIWAVLNSLLLLFYFLPKRFHTHKKHKKHKKHRKDKDATGQKHKKHKKHKSTNKRINDFFLLRCFLSVMRFLSVIKLPFLFLFAYVHFVLFVPLMRVKSFRKKKNKKV